MISKPKKNPSFGYIQSVTNFADCCDKKWLSIEENDLELFAIFTPFFLRLFDQMANAQ